MSLKKIFDEINKENKIWVGKNTGKELEDSFSMLLMKNRFIQNRDLSKDEVSLLKKIIVNAKENDLEYIANQHPHIFQNYTFISQPFGTQNFPDSVIFYKNFIFVVEMKYSKLNKPMWNNSVPEPFAIYIFGTTNNVTFFHGRNQMSKEMRKCIKEYTAKKKELDDFLNKVPIANDIEENPFGFFPYMRVNYQQKKLCDNTKLNYFEDKVSKDNINNVYNYITFFDI